jgi:hypothetical protein
MATRRPAELEVLCHCAPSDFRRLAAWISGALSHPGLAVAVRPLDPSAAPAGIFVSPRLPTIVLMASGAVIAQAVGEVPERELRSLAERELRSLAGRELAARAADARRPSVSHPATIADSTTPSARYTGEIRPVDP